MKVFVLFAALVLAQPQRPPDVQGVWRWQGSAGWQRVEMTFKADGARLTGAIRLGPGGREPQSSTEFWEYFFDPVDFKISNGRISGNTITFEHSASRGTVAAITFTGAPVSQNSASARFFYKGVIEGDQIRVTREVEFEEKDSWSLGSHRVEFVLQRVK